MKWKHPDLLQILLAMAFLVASLQGRPSWASLSRERLWQGLCEQEVQLPDAPLESGFTQVMVEGQALREGLDFRVDPVDGMVQMLHERWLGHMLMVRYRVLRVDLPRELALRRFEDLPWVEPATVPDTLHRDSLAALPRRQDEAASQLRSSGSLLRGVRVGSNGQVDMESGLRLQVEGRIGPDLQVEAFLSDRNTPILPEGRSASLEEVDRIHVSVLAPLWQARLGDVDLALRSGRFLNYRRTVDGLQAGYFNQQRVQAGDSAWALVHLAGARGRFHRLEFPGQEGVQGPWQLRSEQGGTSILVVAGSEQVWVDGVPMGRGEDRDYVMDYALGQLTFTGRRPITADSRIQVEYQYSERLYARSLYGADLRLPVAEGVQIRLAAAGERDDRERPLDAFLDDSQRNSLALAGDGGGQLWGSGVREVDAGKGSWRLQDAQAGQWGHYVWAELPPDSLRDEFRYDLRFSELGRSATGQWLGDYSRQLSSSGRVWYRFEGEGLGAWAPVIPLTAPTAAEVVDVALEVRRASWSLEGEGALSRLDRNLYSTLDDGDNLGLALHGRLRWQALKSRRGLGLGVELGGLRQDGRFQALNPVEEVEFQRRTGLSSQGEQQRLEGNLALRQGDSLLVRPGLSWLRRQQDQSRAASLDWRWHPALGFQTEGQGRGRRLRGPLVRSRLDEARLEQAWAWPRLRLVGAAAAERREQAARSADNLAFQPTGQGHEEVQLRLEQRRAKLEASLEGSRRQRRSLDPDRLAWEPHSLVRQWRSRLRWSGSIRGDLDWTHRVVDYQSADSSDGARDVALLDVAGQGAHQSWSLRYRAEQSLSAERLVQYIQVDSLQGTHSRDPFNPELFVPDPDGDYVAIPWESGRQRRAARLGLEASARWDRGTWSGDHQLTLDELSRLEDPRRLYLLQPAALQGDSTQSGRLISRQDLEWKRGTAGNQRWRLRWQEERSLEQLVQSSSRRNHLRRVGLRLQERLGQLRGWVELERRRQVVLMPGQVQAQRKIQAWRGAAELGREMRPGWTLRTALEGEQAQDEHSGVKGRRLRAEPTLEGRMGRGGSVQARFSWQQAWADQSPVPYELLGGARVGRTWRAGVESRLQLGKQSRLTLAWQVDALPEREAIHSGRVQVQSFF